MGSEEKIPDSNWKEVTILVGVFNLSPGPNNLQFKKGYYAHSDHRDGGGDDNNHDNQNNHDSQVGGAQACGYCQ